MNQDTLILSILDQIWRPPSGGRRLLNAKAYVWLGGRGLSRAVATREQLARILSRAPQVVVKVSGRQRGAGHVGAHFEYVGRHGRLDVETSDGEVLTTVDALRQRAQEWWEDDGSTRSNRVTSISLVLSMPAGTDPETVLAAARGFARAELEGNHRYTLALHDDTDHPHVHLTVAAAHVEPDGRRFNPRKSDLFRMRETFAQELRDRGTEADATARRARGVTGRAENIRLRKLKDRYQKAGQMSDSAIAANRDGQSYALGQSGLHPWEQATIAKQRDVRKAYQSLAIHLSQSSILAERSLGAALEAYVRTMPEISSMRLDCTRAYLEKLAREHGVKAVSALMSSRLDAGAGSQSSRFDRSLDSPKTGRVRER